MTGRAVKSPEALQIGLVNKVVENGKVKEEAISFAKILCTKPFKTMQEDRISSIEQCIKLKYKFRCFNHQ